MRPPLHIFRAGTHTTAGGVKLTFTPDDVAAIAANYNKATHHAPITIGHPESDKPAYGWIETLNAVDGEIFATEAQVEPQFAEMRAAGRFTKISVALYHKSDPANPTPGFYYLRHVTYLGAMAPAIKGLNNFNAAESGIVIEFTQSKQEQTSMTEAEIKAAQEKAQAEAQIKIDAANAKAAQQEAENTRLRAEIDAAKKTNADARSAANLSFAESQVKTGHLLPKDVKPMAAALDLLADSDGKPLVVNFSEGTTTVQVDPAKWLKEFVANSKPQIAFGEHRPAGQPIDTLVKGATDAEIDAAAKAYALVHKIEYAEAVGKVLNFS